MTFDFYTRQRRALNRALVDLRAAKLDARDRDARVVEVQASLQRAKQARTHADKRVAAARETVSDAQVSLNR